MSYTPVNTLFFEPSLSNGTENDRITSFLNLPAVVRISQKHLNLILKIQFNEILIKNNILKTLIELESSFAAEILLNLVDAELFLNKTVREIVNGYEDQLLYTANILDSGRVASSKFSILNGVIII